MLDVLKGNLIDFVMEFHTNAKLPRAITGTLLTLIPKTHNLRELHELRPICLIGGLYRIISKMLVASMKKLMGSLISSCQSDFIHKRQILDGYWSSMKLWTLLREIKRNELCLRWLKWMEAYVVSNSMFLLVNGSPTKNFQALKGLCQRDPMLPFLFLLVVEGLVGLMYNVIHMGEF